MTFRRIGLARAQLGRLVSFVALSCALACQGATKREAEYARTAVTVPASAPAKKAPIAEGPAPLPADLCTAELSIEQLKYLIQHKVDANGARVAAQQCHKDIRAHTTVVMQDLIHIGPQSKTPFFGFGLEEAVHERCLAPTSKLRAYLQDVGVCNRHAQASVVLLCLHHVSNGQPCSISQLAVNHHMDVIWRPLFISVGQSEIPDSFVRDRHGQGVESKYTAILKLLDYLAEQNPDQGVFDAKQSKPYDAARVRRFLWPKGVAFTDPNGLPDVILSPPEVEHQLAARKGRSFIALSHLGYIYGLGFMHYSMLRFEPNGEDRVTVAVGWRFDGLTAHYALTFAKHDGDWKLGRCDYRDLYAQIPPEVIEYWDEHGWPPGMKRNP